SVLVLISHRRFPSATLFPYTTLFRSFPPLLSPLLVKRTTRGMRLVVTGFTGPYTLPADVSARTDHIVHVCAGSGSVPNFSMLKLDRKSTRLNSSHRTISYAVFCLKKK